MKKLFFRLFRVFQRPLIQRLLLVAFIGIIYIPTLPYAFVSDDIHIGETMAGMTLSSVFDTSTGFHLSTLVQYMLYHSVGLVPWIFRFVNIFAHAGSVLLVYAILRRLQKNHTHGHSSFLPFFAATIFAVHPLVIESVVWISGGVYALYGCFFLLSLWFYMRDSTHERLSYGASIVCFIISLLFSEKAIGLPLLFIVYEYSFGHIKKHWKQLLPYGFISLCFLCFNLVKMPQRLLEVGAHSHIAGTGLFYNPFIQVPLAIVSYIQLFFWPRDLTLYHTEYNLTGFMIGLRLILVILGVCSIIWMGKYKKQWFFWMCFFLVPLLPMLTPFRIAWVVAERYAYLSIIGLSVLVISLFDILLHSKYLTKIYGICFLFIVSCLLSRSIMRTHDWYNEDTLWIATSKTSPGYPNTWNNMGDVYSRHGDFSRALVSFQKAIQLDPMYAEAYHNAGETYVLLGDMDQAQAMYEKAVAYRPTLWQSWYALTIIAVRQQKYEKGLEMLTNALRINPNHVLLLQMRQTILHLLETSSKIPQ